MKIDCKRVYCGLVPRGVYYHRRRQRVSDKHCHVSHLERVYRIYRVTSKLGAYDYLEIIFRDFTNAGNTSGPDRKIACYIRLFSEKYRENEKDNLSVYKLKTYSLFELHS